MNESKTKFNRLLEWLAAISLILGFLPSWLGLSKALFEWFPVLSKFSGPINPIKLAVPIYLILLWRNRFKFHHSLSGIFILTLVFGSLSTLVSGYFCNFFPLFIREWFVICLGLVAASTFFVLQPKLQKTITASWLLLLGIFVFLDLFFPRTIDWLYLKIFDPDTTIYDVIATGYRLLTGVFGSQSMAKLLTWTPWLTLAIFFQYSPVRAKELTLKQKILFSVILCATITCTSLILSTSQRGPFIGMAAGWFIFFIHLLKTSKNLKILYSGVAVFSFITAMTVITVPRDLLLTRVYSLLGTQQGWQENSGVASHIGTANYNKYVRKQQNLLSLHSIAKYPLGNACLPREEYLKYGIHPNHSHSLFLEQFRTRGWAWGSFHLLFWIIAWIGAFRLPTIGGAALTAGISAVIVSGLVDHPWFVLNHSMILWLYLILGINEFIRFKKTNSINKNESPA